MGADDIIFQDPGSLRCLIDGIGTNEINLLGRIGITNVVVLMNQQQDQWLEPLQVFQNLVNVIKSNYPSVVDQNHILNCISVLIHSISRDDSLIDRPSQPVLNLIDSSKKITLDLQKIEGVDQYLAYLLWRSKYTRNSLVVTSGNPPVSKLGPSPYQIYGQILKYNLLSPRDGHKIYLRLLSIQALFDNPNFLVAGPPPVCGSGC